MMEVFVRDRFYDYVILITRNNLFLGAVSDGKCKLKLLLFMTTYGPLIPSISLQMYILSYLMDFNFEENKQSPKNRKVGIAILSIHSSLPAHALKTHKIRSAKRSYCP